MTHQPRPSARDHYDLGAHSQHTFRLYGGEEVWIGDVRGKGAACDPDVSVRFKNVHLTGSLLTLQAFAELMSTLLIETLVRRDEFENYDRTELVLQRPAIDGPRGTVPRESPRP